MSGAASDLSRALARSAEAVCRHYLREGRREGRYWIVGNALGAPGRSLYVRLKGGDRGKGAAGKWTDAATGEHGDLLDLIAINCGYHRLADTLEEARHFLSLSPPATTFDPHAPPAPRGSRKAARRLFAASRPMVGTLAETYLRHRGITGVRTERWLRFHPRCWYRPNEDDAPGTPNAFPALISAVTDTDGTITGVHRTWLDGGTCDKAIVATPRRAMGDLLGHGVRFGPPGPVMAAGEGIETILSLRMPMSALPMIATLSSAHLAAIAWPAPLRRLYVVRDAERIMLQFPVQSPDFDFVQRGEGPSFVNVVKLRQYQAQKSIAEALPAATFGTRDSYPTRGRDQFVSREGYVTFHRYSHDDAYLNLPSPKDAITSWLEAKGITATPSDAGRVAEQVIASVGGFSGTNILRERGILEQLNSMARSRREWKDGSADEFTDRTASVQDWIMTLRPIQKKVFGNWKTLDRLVADGMLRLGLAPRCPHCTQENWYSLNDVADQLSCARCLKTYPFPQGNPDRKLFKYRVVGPFATPGYARGGYAVALTLRFLDDELGSMNAFTFSTGLELEHAGGKSETDFFAWYGKDNLDRASRDPVTVVGECKSFAAESFKAADVARLRELATLLPGSIIVAATLKDEFSSTENKALRALAKWGWTQLQPSPLIVLTGQELFVDGPLANAWKESGGTRATTAEKQGHIFDLVTLADATQQAVLGMSSEEVATSRYKRSRALALKRLKLQKEI